eukprot:8201842-Pyramimonas_sp.AAC.1
MNKLYGAPSFSSSPAPPKADRGAAQSAAQRSVLRHVLPAGAPAFARQREAARELLGPGLVYDSGEVPSAVPRFDAALIAVPEELEQPPAALDVLDPEGPIPPGISIAHDVVRG